MATWHQQRRPVRLFHETQWTLVTDPPNGMTTLELFTDEEGAKKSLAGLSKHHPELASHSYILEPASFGPKKNPKRRKAKKHRTRKIGARRNPTLRNRFTGNVFKVKRAKDYFGTSNRTSTGEPMYEVIKKRRKRKIQRVRRNPVGRFVICATLENGKQFYFRKSTESFVAGLAAATRYKSVAVAMRTAKLLLKQLPREIVSIKVDAIKK
jgi:hypothetical protein